MAENHLQAGIRGLFGDLFLSYRDIHDLSLKLQGRSIALVGNASSLTSDADVERRHDLIIRMNRGYYYLDEAGKKTIKKTDILFVSTKHDDAFLRDVAAVVRMAPKKLHRVPVLARPFMYFYPLSWWEELVGEIGSAPSTGCMAIDLVTRLVHPQQVSLFGFDFWRTPTFYTGENRPGPHDPKAEEAFARKRLPHAFAKSE